MRNYIGTKYEHLQSRAYLSQCGDQQAEREGNLRHTGRIRAGKTGGRAADADRYQQEGAQAFGDQHTPNVAVVGNVGNADDLLQSCSKRMREAYKRISFFSFF